MAYIYEADPSKHFASMMQQPPGQGQPGSGGMPVPGLASSFGMTKDWFKSPICLYIEKMSEEDLELTLSVIATANDRIIRTCMLDIYGA